MNDYIIPKEFNQGDRIGNFTIPQAVILGVCVLICMLLLISGIQIFVALSIAPVIFIIGAVFMYYKINAIPLYEFVLIYLVYKVTPKLLIYRADNVRDEFVNDAEYFLLVDEDEDGTNILDLNKQDTKTTKKSKKTKKKKKIKDKKVSKK